MKALVYSDSHGNYGAVAKAITLAKPFDTIIFLSDGMSEYERITGAVPGLTTYCVRGNCDFDFSASTQVVVPLGKHKIFLTHGHTLNVREDKSIVAAVAKANDCEAVLFGHTHCRFFGSFAGITLFNPGSISLPRDRKPACFGIITEQNGALKYIIRDL